MFNKLIVAENLKKLCYVISCPYHRIRKENAGGKMRLGMIYWLLSMRFVRILPIAYSLYINQDIKRDIYLGFFFTRLGLATNQTECKPIAVIAVIVLGVMGSILVRTKTYISVTFVVYCCQCTIVCYNFCVFTHKNVMKISGCMYMYMYIYVYNIMLPSVDI